MGVINIQMAFKAMEVHEITKGTNMYKRSTRTKPQGTTWGGGEAKGLAKEMEE